MKGCRQNEQCLNECLEGLTGSATEAPAVALAREDFLEEEADSGTEHTSSGYWARLLPVAQKADTTNPQEIFIYGLMECFQDSLLSASVRSRPPAAARPGSPIGSD